VYPRSFIANPVGDCGGDAEGDGNGDVSRVGGACGEDGGLDNGDDENDDDDDDGLLPAALLRSHFFAIHDRLRVPLTVGRSSTEHGSSSGEG
jgi:hypothetical protein